MLDLEDIPYDVREDMARERARRAQYRHWCEECHGQTGPGSPCAIEPPEPEEQEDTLDLEEDEAPT